MEWKLLTISECLVLAPVRRCGIHMLVTAVLMKSLESQIANPASSVYSKALLKTTTANGLTVLRYARHQHRVATKFVVLFLSCWLSGRHHHHHRVHYLTTNCITAAGICCCWHHYSNGICTSTGGAVGEIKESCSRCKSAGMVLLMIGCAILAVSGSLAVTISIVDCSTTCSSHAI
eukprot:COSAG05_NODE_4170_length_1642_cov_1.197019_2_plen_176_part_00